ncbi:glycosyltransferase family 2 protein [Pectobacterium cacticida]|uniref:glycosyltransferase family A protein n=1 Tax=Pectobacterium cacticida TaxID=69221 RepID=UPI002FF04C1C
MNQLPLVSIAIPAYKPTFFEAAFLSACRQNYPNIEIVVCDDNRGDEIANIIERYKNEISFPIYYYHNDKQLYEQKNFFKCVSLSNGDYIKFLCDDDLLHNDCVGKLVYAIENNPNITIATCCRRRIDENDVILSDIPATAAPFPDDFIIRGETLISYLADYPLNFIGEPTCILCRKADLIAIGENFFMINGMEIPFLGDLSLCINLLRKGNLAFISETLADFRISHEQVSQKARNCDIVRLSEKSSKIFSEAIHLAGYYHGEKKNQPIS